MHMQTIQSHRNTWKWIAVTLFILLVVQSIFNIYMMTRTEEPELDEVKNVPNEQLVTEQNDSMLAREEVLPLGTEFTTYLVDNYSNLSENCTTLYQEPIKEGGDGTEVWPEKIDAAAVRAGAVDEVFTLIGIEDIYLDFWREGLAGPMTDGYLTEYCSVDHSDPDQPNNLYAISLYFLVDGVSSGYAYVLENRAVGVEDGMGNFAKSVLIPSSDITHIHPEAINGNTLFHTQNFCYGDACLVEDGFKWSYYEITDWDYNTLENCVGYFEKELGGHIVDDKNLNWVCWNEYQP